MNRTTLIEACRKQSLPYKALVNGYLSSMKGKDRTQEPYKRFDFGSTFRAMSKGKLYYEDILILNQMIEELVHPFFPRYSTLGAKYYINIRREDIGIGYFGGYDGNAYGGNIPGHPIYMQEILPRFHEDSIYRKELSSGDVNSLFGRLGFCIKNEDDEDEDDPYDGWFSRDKCEVAVGLPIEDPSMSFEWEGDSPVDPADEAEAKWRRKYDEKVALSRELLINKIWDDLGGSWKTWCLSSKDPDSGKYFFKFDAWILRELYDWLTSTSFCVTGFLPGHENAISNKEYTRTETEIRTNPATGEKTSKTESYPNSAGNWSVSYGGIASSSAFEANKWISGKKAEESETPEYDVDDSGGTTNDSTYYYSVIGGPFTDVQSIKLGHRTSHSYSTTHYNEQGVEPPTVSSYWGDSAFDRIELDKTALAKVITDGLDNADTDVSGVWMPACRVFQFELKGEDAADMCDDPEKPQIKDPGDVYSGSTDVSRYDAIDCIEFKLSIP